MFFLHLVKNNSLTDNRILAHLHTCLSIQAVNLIQRGIWRSGILVDFCNCIEKSRYWNAGEESEFGRLLVAWKKFYLVQKHTKMKKKTTLLCPTTPTGIPKLNLKFRTFEGKYTQSTILHLFQVIQRNGIVFSQIFYTYSRLPLNLD